MITLTSPLSLALTLPDPPPSQGPPPASPHLIHLTASNSTILCSASKTMKCINHWTFSLSNSGDSTVAQSASPLRCLLKVGSQKSTHLTEAAYTVQPRNNRPWNQRQPPLRHLGNQHQPPLRHLAGRICAVGIRERALPCGEIVVRLW